MPRRVTITRCSNCGTNIRGVPATVRSPNYGSTTTRCHNCTDVGTQECHVCNDTFLFAGMIRGEDGRWYCHEHDPRARCHQCDAVVNTHDSDHVHIRSSRGVDHYFCDSDCAENADFYETRDGHWRRRWATTRVQPIDYHAHRNGYYLIPSRPNDDDYTFGVEVEGRFTHAPEDWNVAEDGSLYYSGGEAWEMMSPVLAGQRGMRELRGALGAWKEHNPRICRAAGTHVHVGVGHMTGGHIADLFDHWKQWGEDFFAGLVTRGRFDGEYCRTTKYDSTGSTIRRAFASRSDETIELMRRSRSLPHIVESRRKSLNMRAIMKHGTIEFRLFSTSTAPKKIMGWTAACVNFVSFCERVYGDPRYHPDVIGNACRRYGVMRVGLRLMRGGKNFAKFVRARWNELNGRNNISLEHLARDSAFPWGGNPNKPDRLRTREPVAASEGPQPGQASGSISAYLNRAVQSNPLDAPGLARSPRTQETIGTITALSVETDSVTGRQTIRGDIQFNRWPGQESDGVSLRDLSREVERSIEHERRHGQLIPFRVRDVALHNVSMDRGAYPDVLGTPYLPGPSRLTMSFVGRHDDRTFPDSSPAIYYEEEPLPPMSEPRERPEPSTIRGYTAEHIFIEEVDELDPDWFDQVRVRRMTNEERDDLEREIRNRADAARMTDRVAALQAPVEGFVPPVEVATEGEEESG